MPIRVARSPHNPIIHPGSDETILGNINGPSLIRVPHWIEQPLGAYYLYFAHHQGKFIRMAYADDVMGPYTVYTPGVLHIADTSFERHIASPDVHVEDEARVIRMFYHGNGFRGERPDDIMQNTCLAESPDGVGFVSEHVCLGPSYMRVWQWETTYYGFGGGGDRCLWRTKDSHRLFERGPVLEIDGESFTDSSDSHIVRMRHPEIDLVGHELHVYYSNVGDCPERIKRTTVDLRGDWRHWRGSGVNEVLRTEVDYEGFEQPNEPSAGGASHEPVHQLRDPYVFNEDGRRYLVYSVAGEKGLGIAELTEA